MSSRRQQWRGGASEPLGECGRFRRIPIEDILLGMSVGPATAGISRSEVLTFESGIAFTIAMNRCDRDCRVHLFACIDVRIQSS